MNQKIMKIYIYYLLSKSRTRIKGDAISNQIPVAAHDFLDYGYSVVSSKEYVTYRNGCIIVTLLYLLQILKHKFIQRPIKLNAICFQGVISV